MATTSRDHWGRVHLEADRRLAAAPIEIGCKRRGRATRLQVGLLGLGLVLLILGGAYVVSR